jgi:hypothetical protein
MKALSTQRAISTTEKRLIAAAIRDVLRQHGDVFSQIDPREVRAQLVARLAPQDPAVEGYANDLNRVAAEQQTIIAQRASLVRDAANLRTLWHPSAVTQVVALDRDRALSASWNGTLRLWDLAAGDTLRARCRMHGGAKGSGGPRGDRNGNFKHGLWTRESVAARRAVRAEMAEIRTLLRAVRGRR